MLFVTSIMVYLSSTHHHVLPNSQLMVIIWNALVLAWKTHKRYIYIAYYIFHASEIVNVRATHLSSTIGSGYFASYYPITHRPISCHRMSYYFISIPYYRLRGVLFSCNYTSSSSAFFHLFYVYRKLLESVSIDRVLMLDCPGPTLPQQHAF